MYRDDMGKRILYIRKNVCGYSRRKLANLVKEDMETIELLELGILTYPDPNLILRIADVLDSFYMNFVKEGYEDTFLSLLDWGTQNQREINVLKDLTLALASILINERGTNERKRRN